MRIHKYEIDTVISDDDIFLGTDKDNPGNITKNFMAQTLLAYITNNLVIETDFEQKFSDDYVVVGSSTQTAYTVSIPAGTLNSDGDMLDFGFSVSLTGASGDALQFIVNFDTSNSQPVFSSISGTSYFIIRGNIRRMSSTVYVVSMQIVSNTAVAGVFQYTLSSGDFDNNAYTFNFRLRHISGSATITAKGGYVKKL